MPALTAMISGDLGDEHDTLTGEAEHAEVRAW